MIVVSIVYFNVCSTVQHLLHRSVLFLVILIDDYYISFELYLKDTLQKLRRGWTSQNSRTKIYD